MRNQNGSVFLLKYLYEMTDPEHMLDSTELCAVMEEAGYPADVRTIGSYVDMMLKAGIKITVIRRNGVPTKYCYNDHTWSETELRILVDAVSSAPFITKARTRKLIRKLSTLAGHHHELALTPSVYVSEALKADSDGLMDSLEAIEKAIGSRKKISFLYYDYTVQKRRAARHDGYVYKVSPYSTVWMDDRYYLVGWSDKHQRVVTFRIDRLGQTKVTAEKQVPRPKGYRIQDYAEKITKMYDGQEAAVTLRCNKQMINAVIDKFGRRVTIFNTNETTFDVSVTVSVSGTFLAWLFQYAGEIVLLGPQEAKDLYMQMLNQARDDLAEGEIRCVREPVWKL